MTIGLNNDLERHIGALCIDSQVLINKNLVVIDYSSITGLEKATLHNPRIGRVNNSKPAAGNNLGLFLNIEYDDTIINAKESFWCTDFNSVAKLMDAYDISDIALLEGKKVLVSQVNILGPSGRKYLTTAGISPYKK